MQLKKLILLGILVLIGTSFFANTAFAQERTLLPEIVDTEGTFNCLEELDFMDLLPEPIDYFRNPESYVPLPEGMSAQTWRNNILACGIKTGKIHFWMVPYFIVYIIEFIVNISALIAILFLVIGGYQYIIAGISEKKEEAKNTIKNALIGLVVVAVAWILVNVVQLLVSI